MIIIHLCFRITLDSEYEPDDPITKKLALYTLAHVNILYIRLTIIL
jgi:hypothetical protein